MYNPDFDLDTDGIVLKFLNEHGYHNTATNLVKESTQVDSEKDSNKMLYYDSLFKIKNSSLILNKNIAKEQSLAKQFGLLKDFVHKNDEIYSGELNQVLFPIFCYSYLYLLKQIKIPEAEGFLRKFTNDFIHSKHKDKFIALSRVKKMDDVYKENTAKSIIKEKFLVMMTKEGFELLLKFFEDNQFFMFKSFSNRYINFVISSNLPKSLKHPLKDDNDDDIIMKDKELNLDIPTLDPGKEPYLPSITMFTFFNQKPNTIKIEKDVILSGYDDSIIRLNYPGKLQYSPYSLIGHHGPVYSFSVTPNCEWALSCGQDCTVRLWNIEKKKNVVVYRGHQFCVWDVDFSKNDVHVFASASHDKTARLWVTDRVSPVRIFAGHIGDVDCLKFHPNANFLVTGSSDKTVRLWEVQNGNCVRILIGHESSISCLAYHPGGTYLLSGSEDGEIICWDLKSGKKIFSLNEHFAAVTEIKFKDAKHFVSSSLDFSIKIWDFDEKRLLKSFSTKNTPVFTINILKNNIILAGGAHEKQ